MKKIVFALVIAALATLLFSSALAFSVSLKSLNVNAASLIQPSDGAEQLPMSADAELSVSAGSDTVSFGSVLPTTRACRGRFSADEKAAGF